MYSFIIYLLFLINLSFPKRINTLESKRIKFLFVKFKFDILIKFKNFKVFKSGYFDIILINKDLRSNSANLIKSFQSDQSQCLLACNLNVLCQLVIFNVNGRCILCKKQAINELITGQQTTVFQSQK